MTGATRAVAAPFPPAVPRMPSTLLSADLELDEPLAVSWIDAVLDGQSLACSLDEGRHLYECRQSLLEHRSDLAAVCRPTLRHLDALAMPAAPGAPGAAGARGAPAPAPAAGLPSLGAAIGDATISPANVWGTAVGSALAADALYHSLPAAWRVQMSGGRFELYDANASARRKAFGKAGKAKYPPRMMLRVEGAKMTWVNDAFAPHPRTGVQRAPVSGRSMRAALQLTRANRMVAIGHEQWSRLRFRGAASGNLAGAALALGPQAYLDARDAGLLDGGRTDEEWRRFVHLSARNQSTNLVGFAAGAAVTAGLAAVTVAGAPVILVVGLLVGVGAQAGWAMFGMPDRAERLAKQYLP